MPILGNEETQTYHFKLRQCLSLSHRHLKDFIFLIFFYPFQFLVFLQLYIREQGAEQKCGHKHIQKIMKCSLRKYTQELL